MFFKLLRQLLKEPHKRAQMKVMRLVTSQGSLIFLNGALESGILGALKKPMTFDELAAVTGAGDKGLLFSLLELGLSLGELRCKNGAYRLHGPMARALADGHPAADMVREIVHYHADVALHLHEYIRSGTKGDYLESMGGIIARSSLTIEMLIRLLIYHVVDGSAPYRILEIGCGSGEYLRYYTNINPSSGGIGIDISRAAAEIARESVRKNGIEKNFTIINDNFITTASLSDKEFDLATSYSNLYYFTEEETAAFFSKVHGLLSGNGRFVIACLFKDTSIFSVYLDLLFRATRGLYPLPSVEDTVHRLRNAGFSRTEIVNITGAVSFKGIIACK